MRLLARFARKTRRVVLDTNVLISGTIVPHGMPARIIAAALAGRVTLIVSNRLVGEYQDVTRRRHISKKYQTIGERVETISDFLQHDAVQVAGVPTERVILDDPKDDFLIACAIEGNAEYIVSGDEHLLELGRYRGVEILRPRDFVERVLR